jgi:hypothetical protein
VAARVSRSLAAPIATAYGLSPAERRVVDGLLSGRRLDDIALASGTSTETRTHAAPQCPLPRWTSRGRPMSSGSHTSFALGAPGSALIDDSAAICSSASWAIAEPVATCIEQLPVERLL